MIRRNPDKSSWRRDERPKSVSHGEKPYPVSRIPSAKNSWVRAFGKTSFPDEAERQTKQKIKSQQPTNFSFTHSKFRLLWQTAKKARRSHPKSSKQINPRTKSFFNLGKDGNARCATPKGSRCIPWLKIPRQILTLQNILKHRTNHNFLSLIANGDSSQNYWWQRPRHA